MITSSALVLMMTIPGLGLFYGGMVRKKNVLATLAQSFGATCIITVLWMVIGYSIAFTANPDASMNNWIGGFSYLFLKPMTLTSVSSLAGTIPESVYMFFQMTFAIITPALIAGALADRMKFSAFLWFMSLWLLFVYCPIAHWVWGGGWLGTAGALDYAGGSVVHLNAGTAALVTCLVLGKRKGLGTRTCRRTTWCCRSSAPACCGSAGSASTPVPPSPPATMPAWRPRPPRSRRQLPLSPGCSRNGSSPRSPPCWA